MRNPPPRWRVHEWLCEIQKWIDRTTEPVDDEPEDPDDADRLRCALAGQPAVYVIEAAPQDQEAEA